MLAIPFGLAVGAGVPRELEGTLVLIGVVGMQLALEPDSLVSQLLPFHGPQELITSSLSTDGPIAWPLVETVLYGIALFVLARLLVSHRVEVTRHAHARDTSA
jgi:hypothetical protein